MSAATSLMQCVLGPGTSLRCAREALEAALLSEVDPLHWCATHLGVREAEIMRRTAAWAGLAYVETVPRLARLAEDPYRLEALKDIRFLRIGLLGRDITLAAPDFFGALRLREAIQAQPEAQRNVCLVSANGLRSFLVEQAGPALVDSARQSMVRRWPRAAAHLDLAGPVRHAFVAFLLALTLAVLVAPVVSHGWLIPAWMLFVLVPAVLRFSALCMPRPRSPDLDPEADRSSLPTYTILVPLRDEANMVDQLHGALARLDYPVEKLQVIYVVEATSSATIAAVEEHLDDARFSLLAVPDAAPRTKPKALDFALPLCRGEFLVVYDAEDRPAPNQLLRVAAEFHRQPDIACIQAQLVIDNGGKSLLPSLFAGEYAGLFAVLLPALASWGLVMPLGGTSNHFRTETLRALGGWDAFNVTEDADLGVRLARRGLRCAVTQAQTFEAAPRDLGPWLGQRTRWMKGWMQTYAVHNRHQADLVSDLGWRGMVMFQAVLLGMLLAPLLHIGFWLLSAFYLATGQLVSPLAGPWSMACLLVLVLGHACAIATNLVGLARTNQLALWPWQFLLPVYWLLIALATLRATREFIRNPFHWWKSPHNTSPTPASVAAAPEHAVTAGQLAGKSAHRFGRKAIWLRSAAG